MAVELRRLPIDAITVGERFRTDLGDIASLAASIGALGLLQPLVVAGPDNRLVSGGRRLAAVRALRWTDVEVIDRGDLAEVDRLRAELASDAESLDLTPVERSAAIVRLVEVAQREALVEFRPAAGRKSRGRPSRAGSQRDVAARLGLARTTIHDAQQHLAALERHPALRHLSQSGVLDAAPVLDALEMGRRIEVVANWQQGAEPASAVPLIRLARDSLRQQQDAEDFARALGERHAAAVERYPELNRSDAPPPQVVNAASALDSLPNAQRQRVRHMVEAGALPVNRVTALVYGRPISTRGRLGPPAPMVTDAEATAAALAEQHQARRVERTNALAQWLGLSKDVPAITMAASVPDEDIPAMQEQLVEARAWMDEIEAAWQRRKSGL